MKFPRGGTELLSGSYLLKTYPPTCAYSLQLPAMGGQLDHRCGRISTL